MLFYVVDTLAVECVTYLYALIILTNAFLADE